jgi:hypothetical protein
LEELYSHTYTNIEDLHPEATNRASRISNKLYKIADLYRRLLKREIDYDGRVTYMVSDYTMEQIEQQILNSEEYNNLVNNK